VKYKNGLPVFTDRERLSIYKKALTKVEKDAKYSKKHNYRVDGICNILEDIVEIKLMSNIPHVHPSIIFPEFTNIKPKNITLREYWWNRRNYTIRITKIKRMIKEVESKINKIQKH